ncbi:MAG: M81 family metallopeptidase [Rhodospirillales bacterium]|nr:M81 family metallopeptidase [Rhodospirillales bacterium]
MNRRRIFLGALFHETHGFVDETTGLDKFRIRRGEQLLAREGDGSTIDGFLEVARAEGWHVVPASDWAATPSGPVRHAAFETFFEETLAALRQALRDGGLDGIFLCLHGAMTTEYEEDCEGELLARIRAVPGAGNLPLFGVFDLHATFTARMASGADGLVAYRENPHVDARQAAMRAAQLLAHSLGEGRRPRQSWRRVPVIWPPTGTGTADLPMRALEAEARAIETRLPAVLAVNVVGGFAFADARDAGVSVGAILAPDAGSEAEAALDALAAQAFALRAEGLPQEHNLDAVLGRVLPVARGPVLLVEPADNIGGGAPGDCTDILRALLRHGAPDSGVILNDPDAVLRLAALRPGAAMTLSLGGKGWRGDPGPVELAVEFVSRSEGDFQLEDRNSHLAASTGVHVAMGPCATVRHRGITILLTSRKTPPFDLGQWRSQGIAPERFGLIGVKAAVAHRRAYDPIAAASFTVATRGPCASDLRTLPYRRLSRPIFPLDPDAGMAR